MISPQLARRLRDAGLEWVPRDGDRFMIPDRGLDDQAFSISEMTVDVMDAAGGRQIAFNGAVEWALDSIMLSEVVWLPSETQLRDRLGSAFRSLTRVDEGHRCSVEVGGRPLHFEAADPADAYSLALLHLLEDPESLLRVIVDEW